MMLKKKVKKVKKATGLRMSAVDATEVTVNVDKMLAANVDKIAADEFAARALRTYGSYVVEDRAIPDYRDGLKPSHRAIIWALDGINLRPNAKHKKSARAVGDAMGKFHPHGDSGLYTAMETLVNTIPPSIDGQGNWGTPINMAAAQRYTEAKMSKFTHLFLLDKEYLQVVPKVQNYSGDEVWPVYLPALLPYILFNGGTPPPAYGVKAGNPSFSFDSVSKIVTAMLRGEKYDAKRLSKELQLFHNFGCEPVITKDEYLQFMATGKGSVKYRGVVNTDPKKKIIHITTFVPNGFASTNGIEKALNNIAELKGVKRAFSKQGKKSPGSGPYGALYVIECQKSIKDSEFQKIVEKVKQQVTNSVPYRLGVTVRSKTEETEFKYLNFVQFFQAWVNYRVKLEVRLIKHLIAKVERELYINRVYLYAVEHMKEILAALPKVLVKDDPNTALSKALKIPLEDATIILDRKVRQLAKLEAAALKAKIKELETELKTLKTDLKKPGERAARDTEQRVASYLKAPDSTNSGIPVVVKTQQTKKIKKS
ncbi:DNA topoisomerase IV subunit A [Achromobacter phage Motura]|uniref:DNA topoisomerase IV subunit A n=1 Tax=Achromobacter phage Motura TaxID=2591403 RepID=A0A514CSM8_9CAUD|nr:DNA topoisomerase II [Achromobacter phage Motura]QDH83476.1 DNA topoisomerase IV subunit A [Achromobacter phage Motura]